MASNKIYLGNGVYVEPRERRVEVTFKDRSVKYIIDNETVCDIEEKRERIMIRSIYKGFKAIRDNMNMLPEDKEDAQRVLESIEEYLKDKPEELRRDVYRE